MKRKTKNVATIAITTSRRDTNKPTTRHFPDADVAELYAAAMQMSRTVGALVEDIVAEWVATKRCARTHASLRQYPAASGDASASPSPDASIVDNERYGEF